MKLLPLEYKIVIADGYGREVKTVSGFAVDTMPRICVQKNGNGWRATDYDTGYSIGRWYDDRDKCIASAISRVSQNVITSHYAMCRESALDSLKKAGLL